MDRRGFLKGLGLVAVTAPAIVRASSLMSLRGLPMQRRLWSTGNMLGVYRLDAIANFEHESDWRHLRYACLLDGVQLVRGDRVLLI